MSMDALLLGVTQPPPEICDEKRLKSVPDKPSELVLEPYIASESDPESDTESESEPQLDAESELVPEQQQEPELVPEQEQELEPELESESGSEPELDPRSDWELIPIEKLTVNDLSSRYDDDPSPFYFMSPNFVYKNKVFLKREEDRKKALAEHRELSRGLSPFDAIPIPPLAVTCGNNYPLPITITEEHRPRLTDLSNVALEKFNAKNKGSNFVFDELVKASCCRIPLVTYYITFKAKDAAHPDPSDSPATTFQAHVWKKVSRKGSIVVKSCSIKT